MNHHTASKPFLILLGVSGCGKSTLIKELKTIDDRFVYVSPFTNRDLRPNETDKIHKSDEELGQLIKEGKIVYLNEVFGFKYATPLSIIQTAFESSMFPILDFPLNKLNHLKAKFPEKIFSAYILPPDIETLRRRLSDGRDASGLRLAAALEELSGLDSLAFPPYDTILTNFENSVHETAQKLYAQFMKN